MNVNDLESAIGIIEDHLLDMALGTITFTFVKNADYNLSVVDVIVRNESGIEIFGDLNLKDFRTALAEMAKGLDKKGSNYGQNNI